MDADNDDDDDDDDDDSAAHVVNVNKQQKATAAFRSSFILFLCFCVVVKSVRNKRRPLNNRLIFSCVLHFGATKARTRTGSFSVSPFLCH